MNQPLRNIHTYYVNKVKIFRNNQELGFPCISLSVVISNEARDKDVKHLNIYNYFFRQYTNWRLLGKTVFIS